MDKLLRALNTDICDDDEDAMDIQPLDTLPGTFISKLYHDLGLLPVEIQNMHLVCTKTPGDPNEIKFHDGKLESATFDQMVIYLTSKEEPENDFVISFLNTFVMFASPELLFAALVARFYTNIWAPTSNIKDSESLSITRQRVIDVLVAWMTNADFNISENTLKAIETFYSSISTGPSTEKEQIFYNKLKQGLDDLKLKRETNVAKNMQELHNDQFVYKMNSTMDLFLKTDVASLAAQMTLQNSNIFRSVNPSDLLSVILGRIEAKNSVTFNDLQEHFDRLSRFVSFSIIYFMELPMRVQTFKMWVNISFKFKANNDYAGLFAVIVGLSHASISRLTKTLDEVWKQLGTSIKNQFEELKNLTNFANNFNNYRQTLATTKRPCIPFIGCFQKDWIYFQETGKGKDQICIPRSRIDKCYELLDTVRKYQNDTYQIQENETIQTYLYNLPELPDSMKLMQISMMQEAPSSK